MQWGGESFVAVFLRSSADHTARHPRPDASSTHPGGRGGHTVL